MQVLKLILESFRFSWNALKVNILRTTLSLLGVTIGIFAIIAVFTLVDSLERSIKESLSFLDASNLDIRRFPFNFGSDIPWWEYLKRPYATYEEYEFLQKNLKNAAAVTILSFRSVTARHKSSSSNNLSLLGVAYTHRDVYYDYSKLVGRYFTRQEAEAGANVAIIGYRSVKELFNGANPMGKQIKIKGLKLNVIGYLEEEGGGLLSETSKDENIYIPYKAFQKLYYSGRRRGAEPLITIKGMDDNSGLEKLEAEIIGLMRVKRGLSPKQKDNFSVVRQEAFINIIGSTFDVIGIAGWAIGGFSILVGGFGIANIMFVSVRERTNIIGLQKSLGAKNYFILFQFLFEAVFLSFIGGGVGIFLIWILSFISIGTLDLVLTFKNILIGMGVAGITGIISGIIPALTAARLDPVIAIRTAD
ncbi:MAG: ABC transporter permease [Ekhidna sp.]|nr:ABC transporter permease [Ekhidna sp.]